ncbi:MAG: hypothetical protein IIB17_09925 [Chloroflexi bacterium]|nr:hypothetical protein [Chloroflexota bacterium]
MDALTSSTRNSLSGDYKLSLREKTRYFLNCARDNLGTNSASSAQLLHEYDLPLLTLEELERHLTGSPSPSRLNSISFWQSLPWSRIAAELGEVRVLEIGCGKNGLISVLSEKLGTSLKCYTGIDIKSHESWNDLMKQDSRVSFLQSAAEELPEDVLRNSNMIISNSALEHVRGDLTFFQSHRRFMDVDRPVLQIHVVPSAITLLRYLLHGYRQYTRKAVSRIAATYPDSRCSVVRLGGMWSNMLHLVFITAPAVLRLNTLSRKPTGLYHSLLRRAYRIESKRKSSLPSTFGIVIESALNRPIFDSENF